MKKINKHDNIINEYYQNYEEENRFLDNAHKLEYLTTMRYIKKFAKKGAKILEIGAATGAYSIELAKQGFDVTAVELVEKNLIVMKNNAKGVKNITCLQGDALDLSSFADNSFDIVLNLGPMYHLYNKKDKEKAIFETLRVSKVKGICMFAFITNSSIFWNWGVRKNKLNLLPSMMTKTCAIYDKPEFVFTSDFIEDFNKLFEKTNSKFLLNVATDGIAETMSEYINEKMSNEDYEFFVKWHFATCERLDQQGLSSHILYICTKTK